MWQTVLCCGETTLQTAGKQKEQNTRRYVFLHMGGCFRMFSAKLCVFSNRVEAVAQELGLDQDMAPGWVERAVMVLDHNTLVMSPAITTVRITRLGMCHPIL